MRYPQGSVQLLTAMFVFQVDPAIAHEDAPPPPRPRHLTMQTVDHLTLLKVKDVADSGILSSTTMVGTRHGRDKTLKESAGHRAMQGDVNNIFALDSELSYCSEFVDCDNGMKRGSNITCFEACGEKCCTSFYYLWFGLQNACHKFTGKVCKDGESCNGYLACSNAVIPFVTNSCKGDFSCKLAGKNGTVGNVTNSCKGRESCTNLGRDGAIVGNVYASCKNEYTYFDSNIRSCYSLGRSGEVGNVNASCNGEKACALLGWNGISVTKIENSCNVEQACTELGISGQVGSIVNSCNATTACASLGRNGTVGSLMNSCNAENACESAGTGTLSKLGKITGGIENSCNDNMACMHAGQVTCASFVCSGVFFDEKSCEFGTCSKLGGGITSKLSNCCNSDKACVIADEKSVPIACRPPKAKANKRG